MTNLALGKLVKSNSHIDYVCQIYGPSETEVLPLPTDYAFGTFVRIALPTQTKSWLIGLIYDTVLLNPDFGRLGPRLSTQSELAVFSPDYLNEKATLVGIVTIGALEVGGTTFQGVPPLSALTDAQVEKLTDDQVVAFHTGNPSMHLAYAPLLLTQATPLAPYLLQIVLKRLKALFSQSENNKMLELMLDNLIWQSQVGPFGGGR